MIALLVTKLNLDINRAMTRRRIWIITVMVLVFILLYVTIPIVFFLVTVPQVMFHIVKKGVEMKDLCKHRCRRYRRLSIEPVN